ncbi:TonB-dependent siderophore receptor [Aureimonas mangrovi]|uniref:TonB-dependent siderophore receptor n=1 Tax=Aureimonas mangrovi TaxID=2758041 RepID=UPI00163DC1A6|nr:TonB-dependent siderophore receptor [Aureimonas mangrovi]
MAAGALAQGTVTLDTVVVEGDGTGEGGTGPFNGYVPEDSASATKGDVPLNETPQAVSVVGAEQISDQAARSVVEATRYTPGIRSETFGADTRNDWFLIRGFTSQINSYFLDGLQLQSSDSFATWKVNPYLLERIDVLRGPSSALYGGSNPGGLVNLQSKRPTFQNRGEVSVGVNEFGNVWSGADVEGVSADGTVAYRFVGTGNFGETKVDFTDNDQFAILPTISWAPTESTTLNLYANISKLETRGQNFLPYEGTAVDAPFGRIPRSLFTGEPDLSSFERTQALAGYEFEHRFNNDLAVRQNLRYGRLEIDFIDVYGVGYAGDPADAQLARGNFLTTPTVDLFTVDNQLEWNVETGPLAHSFLFGLDYKNFQLDDEAGYEAGAPLDLLDPNYGEPFSLNSRYSLSDTSQSQLGLYAQDNIKFDRWSLLLSGRYDYVDTDFDDNRSAADRFGADPASFASSEDAFSGRAGLMYNFDNGLAPYASISRSFLPRTGLDDLTGDPFEPEEATQYEVGLKYQPTFLPGTQFAVSVFDLTRDNFVTSDGLFFNRQIGKVSSQGVELEASGQITDDLKAIASYTWYDLEVEEGNPLEIGNVTPATPESFASLWLDYTVPSERLEGLSLGAGVRYTGSSYADTANEFKVDDYVLFDAAIRYEKDNFAAALNASNLFDEETVSCSSTIACFYGEAREVNLTLTYKW